MRSGESTVTADTQLIHDPTYVLLSGIPGPGCGVDGAVRRELPAPGAIFGRLARTMIIGTVRGVRVTHKQAESEFLGMIWRNEIYQRDNCVYRADEY